MVVCCQLNSPTADLPYRRHFGMIPIITVIENENKTQLEAKAYSLGNIKSYNFYKLYLYIKDILHHVIIHELSDEFCYIIFYVTKLI